MTFEEIKKQKPRYSRIENNADVGWVLCRLVEGSAAANNCRTLAQLKREIRKHVKWYWDSVR